jgi:hypothetical protein
VILTSVFTHLYPDAIRRYMREVGRALPPNGAAYVTAFMMDDEFLSGSGPVRPEVSLPYQLRGYCRYGSADDPLHRIAYDQRWLTWVAEDAGLKLQVSQLGTWRRNKDGRGTQDALLLTPLPTPKPSAAQPAPGPGKAAVKPPAPTTAEAAVKPPGPAKAAAKPTPGPGKAESGHVA